MTRLPSQLQPAWPLIKRAHRLATLFSGIIFRRFAWAFGARGLPRRATVRSAITAAREPEAVTIHSLASGEDLRRQMPVGEPARHPAFGSVLDYDVPAMFTADITGGVVVGDYGANLTPAHTLDFETSPYFAISDWRQHPIFLRRRLPAIEHIDGTLLALATRGGSNSYYHFLLDVLPRWGVFSETMPDVVPDALYLPTQTAYQREILALTGLDRFTIVETGKHRAVSADHLLVPSQPNPWEVAPHAMVEWVRRQLPAVDIDDKPKRIYVTRSGGRNTRRLENEAEVWPLLEERGFTRIDPGTMSVRDQIDHFAAADTIVALHGAALTNLVFCAPGVRVLELFNSAYVKHCFWAITDDIEGSTYRYLIGGDPAAKLLTGIQADIVIDAATIIAAVDGLLAV